MYDGVAELLERRRTAPIGDRGNVVNIVSWLLLVVSMCTLVARFCVKQAIKDRSKRYGLDDVLIVFAAIFSVGHTIATSIESFQVLGQRREDLSTYQWVTFQKAEYIGCVLYIANLGCARLSLCMCIKKILPGTLPHTTANVFGCFTLAWALSGILVTLFRCNFPYPWLIDGNKCINTVKWVNYVGVTNIVVEILLVSIPLIVWNLRSSAGKRLSIFFLVTIRLSIVAAVGAQLYFFNHYLNNFSEYWRTVLCVQIAQNLSIITACVPCLHPFIIQILNGSVQAQPMRYPKHWPMFNIFLEKKGGSSGKMDYDEMSSQSSGLPFSEKKDAKEAATYCRPLVTYGLDRSSAHLAKQPCIRSKAPSPAPRSNSASFMPESETQPPKDVFMVPVSIPASRPITSHSRAPSRLRNASNSRSNSRARASSRSRNASHSRTPSNAWEIPQALSDVGVLPLIDWDTDSSDRDSGRDSPSRRPNSEYVFNRSKVISVPEESHLRDREDSEEYYKKYYPPLPSPKIPTNKPPPRNF